MAAWRWAEYRHTTGTSFPDTHSVAAKSQLALERSGMVISCRLERLYLAIVVELIAVVLGFSCVNKSRLLGMAIVLYK